MEYRPCRVRLATGEWREYVYVAEETAYIRVWGVWPEDDPGKSSILISEVDEINESERRIPAHLANKMYDGGESAMGGCFFVLVLADGTRIPCAGGNAIDFAPAGVDPASIVDLIPHAGRDEQPWRTPGYSWCLYSE